MDAPRVTLCVTPKRDAAGCLRHPFFIFFLIFHGCAASHASHDTAGLRLRRPLCFFFAAAPRVTLCVTLRGAAVRRNPFKYLPLAPMHHPTKFHVIPSSSLGGVRRHRDRQTNKQTHKVTSLTHHTFLSIISSRRFVYSQRQNLLHRL